MSTLRAVMPMILFGPAEDVCAWTSISTPPVTPGQGDPLGGTDACQIYDGDAATAEGKKSPSGVALTANVNGQAIVNIFAKQGSASSSSVLLRDTDAAAARCGISITWGSPPTLSVQFGSGDTFTPVDVGGGWYLIRFAADSIVDGNQHELELYGADAVDVSDIGTTMYYVRSAILFGQPLDDAVAYGEPRDGSEHVMAPSGSEDAWIVGRNELLEGMVRWIPSLDLNSPHNLTGWDGRREEEWVNCGWHSFLEFAQDKNTFTWVPDISDGTTNRTVVLQEPMDGAPSLEDDRTRQLDITIRDTSDIPFEGY